MNARPGTIANKRISIPSIKPRTVKYSGGASNMVATTTNMLNNLSNNIKDAGSRGTISSDLVEKLLNAIIGILQTIANNTSSVERIYQTLTGIAKTNLANTAITAKTAEKNSSAANAEVDSNIVNLVGTLAAIAKG